MTLRELRDVLDRIASEEVWDLQDVLDQIVRDDWLLSSLHHAPKGE